MKASCSMCAMLSDLLADTKGDLHRTASTIITHVSEQLKPDAAAILVYDADTLALNYAAGYGFRKTDFMNSGVHRALASQVIRESQPIHFSDLARAKAEWANSQALMQEGFGGYVGLPLMASGHLIGILEVYQRNNFQPNTAWWEFAKQIAGYSAQALSRAWNFRQLKQVHAGNGQMYDSIIEGWTRMLELRDSEPKGHSKRVTELAVDLARVLGLGEQEVMRIRRGALLHDVGKMGIPDTILLKAGSLTDEEWVIMRQHPVIAYEQLGSIAEFQMALEIPYCHHENWDGTGYPRGLAGEAIPFAARLFALVDTWDILRSDRPFRKAWPEDKVKTYILERAGKNFDPYLATKFTTLLDLALKNKRAEADGTAAHGNYASTIIHV